MFIRTADPGDMPRLSEILSAGLELAFDVAPLAQEKLFGPGFGGPARCRVILEGGIVRGVVVTSGSSIRLLVVDPEFRGRGIGTALLDDALDSIRRDFDRVFIGAAPGNYLVPGVPVEHTDALEFLGKRGFVEHDRAIDMIADLSDVARPDPIECQVTRVTEFDERLSMFLEEGFGRAIAWEIGHGLLSDRSIVRIATSGDAILGFTACEINNAGLGSFGPQGVAEAMRGKGLGRHLLQHSLADLRELGYATARIPWVSSVDYYARSCAASVVGQYSVMRQSFDRGRRDEGEDRGEME